MSETKNSTASTTLPDKVFMSRIYVFRDQKVMLDRDLAELYGVETKQLKRQVRRNIDRFPEDFMFNLNMDICLEIESVKHSLDNHSKNIDVVFHYLDKLSDKITHNPPLLPHRERLGIRLTGKSKNERN